MIVDFFRNCEKYFSLNSRFKKAFEYIENVDFETLKCGRYEIDGNDIYANVEEYKTKTVSKPEYHKKYIDIQFLAKGEELIGYCPLSELVIDEDYNAEKDLGFGLGVVDYVKIRKNQFMILFPDDAHQPCMAYGKPEKVKKVVVKVRVDG